jgi:DNA-binding NtrC family response regulator
MASSSDRTPHLLACLVGRVDPGQASSPVWPDEHRGRVFTPPAQASDGSRRVGLKAATLDAEYDLILETLKKVNYNKSKAAKLLNIDRKTIYNKIKQFKEQHVAS